MHSRLFLGAKLAMPVFALSILAASVFAQTRTGDTARPLASSASVGGAGDFWECRSGGVGAGASAGASAGGAAVGAAAGVGAGAGGAGAGVSAGAPEVQAQGQPAARVRELDQEALAPAPRAARVPEGQAQEAQGLRARAEQLAPQEVLVL